MSKLKDILDMSRHERRGALAVLVIMAVIIGMMAAGKACTGKPTQSQTDALLQWAAHADSAKQAAAATHPQHKAHRKAAKHKHTADSTRLHRRTKKAAKKRNTPPAPTGLPEPIPNY